MLVYRLENYRGKGPYARTTHKYHDELLEAHSGINSEHPNPWNDLEFDLSCNQEYYCGFHNRQSLLTWFDGFMDKLTSVGFYIAVYSVSPTYVKCGRKQLVFDKSKAKLIQRYEYKSQLEQLTDEEIY